ncbi:MAG: WYL domain-containing protein [Gemmatimonadota bacterium]|jgi:proteasome accessory factor C
MADGSSAAERLERLLHIFPAASVEGGVSTTELARELGVDRRVILDDLAEVTARSFYHPPGFGDDIQIHLEADRLSVWTTGAFERPVKLSPAEAFCLALGLRRDGVGSGGGAPHGDLLRRVEAHLATADLPEESLKGIRAADAGEDPEGVRDLITGCARTRTPCWIRYLKPTDTEPERRRVHPYALVHAEGAWYLIAWCERSGGGRAFRLDRVLDAARGEGEFEVRADVEVEAFLEGGRVYHADEDTVVTVRYSNVVARWVGEWARDVEKLADGGLLVRHRVADPDWVVRHVLAYGGEAEVLEPEAVRELLA